ncbi:MAG: sulfotransferase [Planctomycetota bacterium]|nr:MAG: sulfotransferase [Planctomycetota bacterium]
MLDRLGIWTLARQGPVVRLTLWLGLALAAGGALHGALLLAGDGLSPKSARTAVNLLLFASALLVMSRSERPASAFGLAIGDRWAPHALLGLALGAGALVFQAALAVTVGGWSVNHNGEYLGAIGKAMAGVPIAVPAAVVYAGFVAGSLRERLGPGAASVLAGLAAFIVHAALADPSAPGEPVWSAASIGLAIALAARARFITGDIALGAGLLAGVLVVERFVRKAPVLTGVGSAVLAPDRVLLPAPALVASLAEALVALTALAPAERAEPGRARLSPAFLRAYPFATMGALAPIDLWLRVLTRARWRVGAVYIPRLVVTLGLSAINSALSLPERLLAPILTRRRRIPPPVFILGAHRSGTTHLHNLMSLDPAFWAPTAWQVMNPHGFLVSGWIVRPIFALFAPWRRPQDAVAFGLSAPAEEEYAVANTTDLSPDWSVRLPREHHRYDRFCFPDRMTKRQRDRFGAAHRAFLRRATVGARGRTPLLKSPHNTGRLALLASLYPGARFVHIRRDPEAVYRSNIGMQETAHRLFQLQDPPTGGTYADRFPGLYAQMETRFYADADARGWAGVAEVRYEDLAADPRAALGRIYDALGLTWTEAFDRRLSAYLGRIAGYTPSGHAPLAEDHRRALADALGPLLDRLRDADARPAGRPGPAPAADRL